MTNNRPYPKPGDHSGKHGYHDNKEVNQKEINQTVQKRFQNALQDGFIINGATNPILIDLTEEIAAELKKVDPSDPSKKQDTVNQVRKFFNEARRLEHLNNNPPKLGVEFRMLKARLEYAAERGTISRPFQKIITLCLDKIIALEKPEQLELVLKGFCEFFEALYAYYYYKKSA